MDGRVGQQSGEEKGSKSVLETERFDQAEKVPRRVPEKSAKIENQKLWTEQKEVQGRKLMDFLGIKKVKNFLTVFF